MHVACAFGIFHNICFVCEKGSAHAISRLKTVWGLCWCNCMELKYFRLGQTPPGLLELGGRAVSLEAVLTVQHGDSGNGTSARRLHGRWIWAELVLERDCFEVPVQSLRFEAPIPFVSRQRSLKPVYRRTER